MTIRWCAAVAALAVAGACSAEGDGPETAPATTIIVTTGTTAGATTGATAPATPTATIPVTVVIPDGFGTVSVTVTGADGRRRELCLHLADTPELRSRGLMGVTDLGGLDGMLFHYDAPQTGRFWMKDTVLPLSIAFYAADGTFVSATDMEPCPPGTDCPRYGATGAYTAAIEVPQGGLGDLGLSEGSTLTVATPTCP